MLCRDWFTEPLLWLGVQVPGDRFQRSPGAPYITESGYSVLKKWKFELAVEGGAIVLTHLGAKFRAVYYKPHGQPRLVLRER